MSYLISTGTILAAFALIEAPGSFIRDYIRDSEHVLMNLTGSQCRHQYCWDCLAPWTQIRRRGNDAHAETCRFHSRNLVSHPADVARIQRIQRRRVALTVRPNAEPAATTLQTPAPGCRSGSTQHTTNRHAGTTSRSINKRTGIKWRPRSRVGAELSSSAG